MNILQQILQKVDSVATPVTIDVNIVKTLFPFIFPKEDLSTPDAILKSKIPSETKISISWPYILLALSFALYAFLYMCDTIIFLIGFVYPMFYSHILVTQSASQNDLVKIIKYWMLFMAMNAVNVFVGFPVYLRLIQVYMLIRDQFECVTHIYDGIFLLAQMVWTSLDENFHLGRFFAKSS